MDLRQLTTLVAVADHRTFSAAAKALFTVQSNVSAHIAKLERELGVTLYDRSRGTLTEAGQVVVARARRVQLELEALRADLASLGAEVAGDARLGMISTTARWLLPRLLDALSTCHPGVHLVVISTTTASLLPQLASGSLDAALLALPVDDPDLIVLPLFEEELVLVAPVDHPLAAKPSVTLAEVAAHPLLLEAPGTSLRREIDLAAEAAGVELQAAAEVDGVRLLAAMAIDGHGLALVPTSSLPRTAPSVAKVPVERLPPRVVGLARSRRGLLSTPARAVLDTLQHVLADQEPPAGVRVVTAPPATPVAGP
jgi:LysR family hydrogen peroxide-inducible transcriptional activator